MNRRGAVDTLMLATVAGLSAIGAVAAWALQGVVAGGPSTPELIMIGFQVIGLGVSVFAINEARAERRDREKAIAVETKAREDLARMEGDARAALHKRFDDFLKDKAKEAGDAGEWFGSTTQKVQDAVDRIHRVEDKVDGVGSKVAAQVQLHLDGTRDLVVSTLAEFRRTLERLPQQRRT